MSDDFSNSGKFKVEFSIADMALVISALQIEANTALLYGERREGAIRQRLGALLSVFEGMYPLRGLYRSDAHNWFRAFTALETCSSYQVRIEQITKYRYATPDYYRFQIICDSKSYEISNDIEIDKSGILPVSAQKSLEEITDLAKRTVPFEAEYMIEADIELELDADATPKANPRQLADDEIRKRLVDANIADAGVYVIACSRSYRSRDPGIHNVTISAVSSVFEALKTTSESLPAPSGL